MYLYIYVCIYVCIYIYVHLHWQKTSKRNKEKKNLDRINTYSIIYTYLYIYYCIYIYYIYIYILYYIYIYIILYYIILYIYHITYIYIYLCVFIYMRNKTTLFATPKRTYGFKYIHEDQNWNFFWRETTTFMFQGVTIHILKINQTSALCFICAKTLACHLFSSIAVVRTQMVPRSFFEMYCPQLYNHSSCNPKDQEKMMEWTLATWVPATCVSLWAFL